MSGMASGSLSSAAQGQVIDFEHAELRRVPFQDSLYLWVRAKVGDGYEMRLAPRVYHERPDYWGIEVVAFTPPGIREVSGATDAPGMTERSVPLAGITGIRGVNVIGASQTLQIEIDNGSL